MATQKLVATLKEKAEAVQVVVTQVPSREAAFAYAIKITREQGGASIAAPGWDAESLAALKADCQQAGLELLGENLRERAAAIHTGLTRADWGIADTGTLVVRQLQLRGPPPGHHALRNPHCGPAPLPSAGHRH